MSLRPYQENAIHFVRTHFASGVKRVLLQMPTGSGKTVCFSYILKQTVQRGKRAIMVVHGRELVEQAHKRLLREGVDHGVLMGNHWLKKEKAAIQICSIDTLRARNLRPPADLIVIDEAHMAVSKSYKEFLAQYPEAYILGVTATPYTRESLLHVGERLVNPIGMQELIDLGFLVPPKYYSWGEPEKIKTVAIDSKTGDYNQKDLASIMQESVIMGDIISEWTRHAFNRPTIVFAVTVEHSHAVTRAFNERGIGAIHIDAKTPDVIRQAAFESIRSGEAKILSSVGVLSTGFDFPEISCLVLARPTRSYNLYMQQMGRGTRLAPGKNDFIVLDHAGNVLRHGFITEEREVKLEGTKKTIDTGKPVKLCQTCFMAFQSASCPSCGPQAKKPREYIVDESGRLSLIQELTEEQEILRFIELKKQERREKGYKSGWLYYQVVNKYGEETAKKYVKKRIVPHWIKR